MEYLLTYSRVYTVWRVTEISITSGTSIRERGGCFNRDRLHFYPAGTRVLAKRITRAIEKALN